MTIKGGTPKSDKSPLKWDPPPIKQPWGLLIRGQHYIQILYESHVFIFVSFQAFNSQVGKPLHAFQDIVYMWKVFVWNRATYKMCQRCPTIRPIVDQQSVRWNNFLNSLIVLMVTLQAFLLDLHIVRMKSKLTAPRCHRGTHPHIWRPLQHQGRNLHLQNSERVSYSFRTRTQDQRLLARTWHLEKQPWFPHKGAWMAHPWLHLDHQEWPKHHPMNDSPRNFQRDIHTVHHVHQIWFPFHCVKGPSPRFAKPCTSIEYQFWEHPHPTKKTQLDWQSWTQGSRKAGSFVWKMPRGNIWEILKDKDFRPRIEPKSHNPMRHHTHCTNHAIIW